MDAQIVVGYGSSEPWLPRHDAGRAGCRRTRSFRRGPGQARKGRRQPPERDGGVQDAPRISRTAGQAGEGVVKRGTTQRPSQHESWCPDWGYENCTCELEERQMHWDVANRTPDAAPLPVARLLKRQSR